MDLIHAKKATIRFHKAAVVIASYAMGSSPKEILDHGYNLPLVVHQDGIIAVICLGHPQRADDDFISPYIVNAAFSLELNLKLCSFLENAEWPTGHDLHKLFETLSDERQKRVQAFLDAKLETSKELKAQIKMLDEKGFKINWNVYDLLLRSNLAFQKWRYAFEAQPGCFAGYSQIHAALREQIEEFR